jgi:tRNA(Ile)-lysidine synthase
VLAYLTHWNIPFRDDASNENMHYARAVIRSLVLPRLVERHGDTIVGRIAAVAARVGTFVDSTYRDIVRRAFESASGYTAEGAPYLDVRILCALARPVRGRVLVEALRRGEPGLEVSRAMVEQVERLMVRQTGRRVQIGSLEIWRDRTRLVFATPSPYGDDPVPVDLGKPAYVDGFTLTLVETSPPENLSGDPRVEHLDLDRLSGPLEFRRWRNGDRFTPLGMTSSKKISDYLTDRRVPTHLRDRVWVLTSGDTIIYVVGHGISHHVRVRPDSTRVVRIEVVERENECV